jgi:hypothetical protein
MINAALRLPGCCGIVAFAPELSSKFRFVPLKGAKRPNMLAVRQGSLSGEMGLTGLVTDLG